MQRTGLYYPYVHFRDASWIKAAALYLPEMARVVPEGFRVSDPDHVRVLRDELGFVQDIDPADAVEAASRHLLRVVEERGEELRSRFGVTVQQDVVDAEPSPPDTRPLVGNLARRSPSPWDRPLAGLYPGEMSPELQQALSGAGLSARRVRNSFTHGASGEWLGMDPALAWVYKCALTAELAALTAFLPVTDQEAAHTAAGPWDA
ncbi:DUF6236 family protein, partial [Streptomyces pilosus]